MTREQLVPRRGVCETIPGGEFTESLLVWGEEGPVWREEAPKGIPAPTLEEILEEIAGLGAEFCYEDIIFDGRSHPYPTDAETALLLWFMLWRKELERARREAARCG